MSSLGAGLVWSGLQVSLLILAGAVVYVPLRRRGPAAGSLVALALLTIAIGLSALALSPWPSWWRLRAPASIASIAERAAPEDQTATASNGGSPAGGSNAQQLGAGRETSKSATAVSDAAFWARTFWEGLWDGLSDRAASSSTTASRWPSVAAWLLAIGMTLGLARLGLGLAAVRAYRRRTRPVTDSALNALLDATCARLDCHRAIELRESAEIGSPATVGWRRPLVLLPPEWREWSENERQVVLAHEVAHVARGDFAGWFVAQLSVALHFYNPLVHWLARRLRIEQELAADAWGAMAAGGSGPYLMTLASMALRQDDRAASWTARPFLPARGTLLRRIDMLRNRKQPEAFTFSGKKRILLCSALAALGIVVAGLRGPGGTSATAAPPDNEPTAKFTGFTTNSNQPIDLNYVPPDAALVMAVRPADLIKSDAGKLLMQSDPTEAVKLEQMLGFPISEIEYAKCIINDFRTGAPSRMILHSTKPRDWAKFAGTIVSEPVAVESTLTALAGKKYFKPGNPKALHSYPDGLMCYFLPDERTIIFAPEREMPLVVAASVNPDPEPKWAKTWQRAATGHLAVMLDVEKLRSLIEPDLKRGSGGPAAAITAMMGPLWQDCQRLLVGTELSDKKLGLLALAECPNEEAAGRVEHTSQALLTFALNGLAQARDVEAGGPPDMVAIKKLLVGAAEELLKQARVTREGSTVVVQSQGGGATFLAAAGVALPAIQKARESASRLQSMNNLKQLALAMHVYNDAHGHLPPAVVMGPDGKTPHSWRVEVLPYIEQDQLYKQYKQDEPWDSDANKKVLAQIPVIFRSPSEEPHGNDADYFVLTGKGTMFSGKDGIKFSDITGGTSNTIMIVEAKRDIPWTKPEDIECDPSQPLPKLGGHSAGGFAAAFADGSVRFIGQGVDEKSLKALIDPSADGKAKLDPNWLEHGAAPPGTSIKPHN